MGDIVDVLLDARLAIRGLGIGTFLDRLIAALSVQPGVRLTCWRGAGDWDRRGRLSTLGHSGLFDVSPRLDPRVPGGAVVHFGCNFGSLFPGPRSVLTVHDLMHRHRRRPQDRATDVLQRQCLHRAGRVVAVSEQTRAHIEVAVPRLTGRVTVIPHGMRQLRRPEPGGRFILAFGGGADPRKRVPLTIEAYREYRTNTADPLPLVVLTRAGLLEDQRADLLRLGASLVPSATPAEVDKLMSEAAALIYPTAEEGFGLPILEAAEVGTPVVVDAAARVPREVIGPHCVQIADCRAAAWANGLRHAISLGPVFGSLSLPSWESVAAKYVEVYKEVQRGEA